jgi:hypothetical protein
VADLRLRNQVMRLRNYRREAEFRGGVRAIGGNDSEHGRNIVTVYGGVNE